MQLVLLAYLEFPMCATSVGRCAAKAFLRRVKATTKRRLAEKTANRQADVCYALRQREGVVDGALAGDIKGLDAIRNEV